MTENATPYADARQRLNATLARGAPFEREGFPLGSLALRNLFEEEVRGGSLAGAGAVVDRSAALVDLAERRWAQIERLLGDVDALRDLAGTAGMDLVRIDAKAGNPRELLLNRPPSEASLDAVARAAGTALATLREALPRYCVGQARALGQWARDARARGEDVDEAVEAVGRVVRSLHDLDLVSAVAAIAEARRLVVRSARPANPPTVPVTEEEAILREAHNLARRLSLAEPTAGADELTGRGAPANFLAASVPLTPEEEVEALWAEVERLAHERELASSRALYASAPVPAAVAAAAAPQDAPPLPPALPTPNVSESPEEPPREEARSDATQVTPTPIRSAVEQVGETSVPAPEATAASAPTPPSEEGADRTVAPPPEAPATRASARISFSAAYVPPAASGGPHRPPRASRAQSRRGRSRHRP